MKGTSEFDDGGDDGIIAIGIDGGGLGGLLGALLGLGGEGGASKIAHVLAMKAYNERLTHAVQTIGLAHLILDHATPEQKRQTLADMARDWQATDEKHYPGDAEVLRRLTILNADGFAPAKVEGEKVMLATLFDATLYDEFPCCEHIRARVKQQCDEAALMRAKSPDGMEHRAN